MTALEWCGLALACCLGAAALIGSALAFYWYAVEPTERRRHAGPGGPEDVDGTLPDLPPIRAYIVNRKMRRADAARRRRKKPYKKDRNALCRARRSSP